MPKAGLINICILTLDEITTCNVKGVARGDKPTERDEVSDCPVSTVEHLAAEEPDISLRSW